MKDFFNSLFNNIDDKTKKKFLIILIVFVAFIVFIIVMSSLKPKYITYKELETKLKNSAQKYYKIHKDELPLEVGKTTVIKSSKLEKEDLKNDEKPYIDDIKKLVDDSTCSGYVEVTKISKTTFKYQPYVECKEFKTEFLVNKIINKEKIRKEDSFDSGLYKINDDLFYRGDVNIKNFVKINNNLFRVYKIDKNNDMYLILDTINDDEGVVYDDRYNIDEDGRYGVNDYKKSRIYNYLRKYNSIYKNEKYILPQDVCIDKMSGTTFTRNFNLICQNVLNDQYVSLFNTNDYLKISLDSTCSHITDEQCGNYNYLVDQDDYSWWLLNTNADNTYKSFYVNPNGYIDSSTSADSAYLRYTLKLSKEALYEKGNGTKKNPYIIR